MDVDRDQEEKSETKNDKKNIKEKDIHSGSCLDEKKGMHKSIELEICQQR